MNIKHVVIVVAVTTVLAAGGAGLYSLGLQHGMTASTPVAASMPKAEGADRKPLYWHDPMVPGQKFDKPGKSPFMDMQLVPVYANDAGDEGTVAISPGIQQNLGIRTAEVIKGSLGTSMTAIGSIAYNDRDVALVQARSNGFVEKLYVRAVLDRVRKGQPLAELYVPDWIAAQEEFLTVRRMRGTGLDTMADAAKQRMRLAGMTDDQIRLIESTGKIHPRITITAPISGVVAELRLREGMTIATGAPLMRINGLATVWVNAEIAENLAAQVRPGNAVEARTPALPGSVFKGSVGAILPEVNPSTRTIKARIELANPTGQLVPGMFATLNFTTASQPDVLLVPSEAVIQTGTRSVVIAAQGDGKFVPFDVETGAESNGRTEIRKGLEAGQKVVVSGQFLIDSEASLKGTTTRMADPAAPGTTKAPPTTHRAEGKVEKIGKDEITISHGPVPSIQWGPMTMGFKLPATGLPKNIAEGDVVTFDFRPVAEGKFEITRISPIVAAPASSHQHGSTK